jgi:uncharacterized protein YecE (DUF72 family)
VPGRIIIGTSSWADPGFVADWYPPDMAARDRLSWYAERFEAVEVNSTFYAVPQRTTVERWAEVTPPGFTFDVKLHRLLSRHAAPVDSLPPDLRDEVDVGPRGRVKLERGIELHLADKIIEAIEPLEQANKLGALLLQLSPAFAPGEHTLQELDPLLERLAPRPVAIELRHKAWVAPERLEDTLEAFEERKAAFVCVDAPEGKHVTMMPGVDAVTRGDLAYFRLHGRNAEGYASGKTVAERFGWVYSDDELQELAGRIRGLADQGADVRTMFNNNRSSDAPSSARRMREILGQDPGPEPVRAPAQGSLL